MLELPKVVTIANQMGNEFIGRRIETVSIAEDRPCPECGTPIERISSLGGTCCVCPSCQAAP